MKLVLVLTFLGISCASGASLSFNGVLHKNKTCQPIMKKHHLSGRFPGAVAHGIHSITLEDIRYYFDSKATESNGVPTLNYNLKDRNTVLPNAQLYGFDTSFKTAGLRYVDQVLMNMDRKDFYLTGYNTLEQLVHTLHMGEVWSHTKEFYDRLMEKKFDDGALCACVNDIDGNGIMKMLPFMSLKIRYPGLTAGKVLKLKDGAYASWSGNLYHYSFFNEWSDELAKFNFNQVEENTIVQQARNKLRDGDEGIQHLTDQKAWSTWKRGMQKMVAKDNYELAVFLYCKLKQNRPLVENDNELWERQNPE